MTNIYVKLMNVHLLLNFPIPSQLLGVHVILQSSLTNKYILQNILNNTGDNRQPCIHILSL